MSNISHDDVGTDLRRIVISGRLDTTGTNALAARLAELTAAPRKGVVVDLCGCDFLASVGVGAIVTGAKAVKDRGGRLVLVVGDNSAVMMSLKTAGIDMLIPVFRSGSDAEKAALL